MGKLPGQELARTVCTVLQRENMQIFVDYKFLDKISHIAEELEILYIVVYFRSKYCILYTSV